MIKENLEKHFEEIVLNRAETTNLLLERILIEIKQTNELLGRLNYAYSLK